MKNIKVKNYTKYLQKEYNRLNKSSASKDYMTGRLKDLDDLLMHIDTLKSPAKERAFVDGIILLNHIPSIAA